MINKLFFEKYQVLIYLTGIIAGVCFGAVNPALSKSFELALWPLLAFLLYVTFTQIPIAHIPKTFLNYRVISASLIGNFIIIPIVVALILAFLPRDPVLRLGVAMVLLAPCTDWFITFTQIGKGDTKFAVALAPVILFAQIFLLPVFIFILFGAQFTISIASTRMIEIFILFFAVPLILAFISQRLAETRFIWRKVLIIMGNLPIPLLTIIVFIIFSSQFQIISGSRNIFGILTIVFSLFLVFSAIIAKILSLVFKLPIKLGRVLAFNFGTRNSFVVLPILLSLPENFHTAIVVVAFQPLIELIGMLIYIKYVPNILLKHQY